MANDPRALVLQELEYRKCFPANDGPFPLLTLAASLVYFIRTYVRIWTKEGGEPIPFDLWPVQEKACIEFIAHRLVIILKTRQLGMSWLACAYIVWQTMRTGNFHAYFGSIGLKEATEQHERIKFIYDNLPYWMQQRIQLGGRGKKRNDTLSQFSNGSAIHMVATTKKAGHGAAPSLYVLDEFARNEQDVMTLRAVLPAVGQIGQVIIVSTANGLGNKYAEMWMEAIKGESNFLPLFFGAQEHPLYTPEFLEREKLNYAGDPVGYMEAYPQKWEDAFQSSSRCPFDAERIKFWQGYFAEHNIRPVIGRLKLGDDGTPEFEEDPKGPLMIWKKPRKGSAKKRTRPHRYTVGADVAEGLTRGDFSAAVVGDSDTNEVVALYRHKIPPEYYGHQLELLASYYNKAWLCVEVNKSGETVLGDLKDTYPNLYTREVRENIVDQPTIKLGFYTSSKTKVPLITRLRQEFHDPHRPLRIYSSVILAEMVTFEEDDKGGLGATGANHDDTVIATALMIEARKTAPKPIRNTVKHERDWRSL